MPRYWVMRVDHREARDFLWSELQDGRLRQGWGYHEDQNLETIATLKAKGKQLSDPQRDTWPGNRRMLGSEPDSIAEGDLLLVPHLPHYGRWSLVRVAGPYRFAIPAKLKDYGHILPVELLSRRRPINPHEPAVSASLRRTVKTRLRLWNIDDLGPNVESIRRELDKEGPPPEPVEDRLDVLLRALEDTGWAKLDFHFQGTEFEKPCVRLLQALYGKGNVDHTGGKNENGADAICTYQDPLGVPHRVAVQIKMWTGEATWTRPLEQIEKAYESYEGITSGVILSTSESVSKEFEDARLALARKLKIPIRVLVRRELLRLFIAHLPALVGDEADARAMASSEQSSQGEDVPQTGGKKKQTFAGLFPQRKVTSPTESTPVTSLAWQLGNACGLKLVGTYQLPPNKGGAHGVVFLVKGAVTPEQQAALVQSLEDRAGSLKVVVGPYLDKAKLDLGDEPASAFQALVATFPT